MMNENNEVFTMEDEPVATAIQNMLKGSKWLSAFLESYRPPLDGEHYLTDKEVAEMLRVSPAPCRSIAITGCCPLSFWQVRCFIPNRDCVNCWRRITSSRRNKAVA